MNLTFQVFNFKNRGVIKNEDHLFLNYFKQHQNITKIEELGFQDIIVFTIQGKQYWCSLYDFSLIENEL
jgi:hypothetical protein